MTHPTIRLGVLDVFRLSAADLSDRDVGLALAFTDTASAMLLDGSVPEDGDIAGFDDMLGGRAVVFQAQGMLTSQLGVGLTDAMLLMRAHAYAHGRRLTGDLAL